MDITIQIDEKMFKDVVEEQIKALSPEVMGDIIADGIKEYIKSSSCIGELMFKKEGNSYNSYSVPTQFMVEAGKLMDLSPAIKEIQEDALQILRDNMYQVLISGIASWMSASVYGMDFQTRVRGVVENTLKTMPPRY